MKVVGLVSGGKDSCYNMMQCVAAGHDIVALANIQPTEKDELDSYMYQTVGHQGITMIAEAMQLPLFRRPTTGNALEKGRIYQKTENDEVEDLYYLLKEVKDRVFIEGVAVGAILSDYQRVRVENVCSRLGLISLAYLWRRDQTELLQEMINCQVHAIVIKVAALGLEPNILGQPLWALQPQLLRAKEKYGLNVCGEGGEFETFTLDCPLFKQKIVVDETQVIIHSNDPIAPVGYINLLKLHLEPKSDVSDPVNKFPQNFKTSIDFISDINESSYSDISDIEASETELENTEELQKIRRQSMSENSSINPLIEISSEIDDPKNCPSILIEDSPLDSPIKDLSTDCTDDARNLFIKTDKIEKVNGNEVKKPSARRRTMSSSIIYPLGPIEYELEKNPIADNSCINSNTTGWHWIGGIVGLNSSSKTGVEDAMNKLCSLLSSKDLQLNNICSVTLYIKDMGEYLSLNDAYVKVMNFPNPPARVCVECPLPDGVDVILEALAHKSPEDEVNEYNERHTMHVQGISHWAPANIGPYSQAVRVGDIISVAGQIPLIPGSMTLVEGNEVIQCRLALRHIQRILNAMDPKTQIRDVVQAVCFVNHPHLIVEARRQWERRTNNAIVDYVVVPRLPRDSPIEWHVWAHRHNSRFEYEETGCSVGEYKIAIRRRWNYENNVSAAVCYVATASSPSTSQLSRTTDESIIHHKQLASIITVDEIIEILKYCTNKLLSEYTMEDRNTVTVSFRVFYKVSDSPNVDILINALKIIKSDILNNLTFTVVPVIHLHNIFTFLSISAVRHEL